MDLNLLQRQCEFAWEIPRHGAMRVPGILYASEQLVRDMDRKVYEQVAPMALRHEQRLLAHLDAQERDWLDRILTKLDRVEAQHLAD